MLIKSIVELKPRLQRHSIEGVCGEQWYLTFDVAAEPQHDANRVARHMLIAKSLLSNPHRMSPTPLVAPLEQIGLAGASATDYAVKPTLAAPTQNPVPKAHDGPSKHPPLVCSFGALDGALAALRSARRGLVVVGELARPEDAVAARRIGAALGWPVVTDVLSGG